MRNQVDVVNRALTGIGCQPITSFAAPGPAAQTPQQTFERILDDLLSKYPWSFAHTHAPLDRLTALPPAGWTAAFALPSDRIGPPRAYYESANDRRPFTRFHLTENMVYADASQLWAFYPRLPHPAIWPGYFSELIILCLQAEFALSIREDHVLRDKLRRDAYGPPETQGMGGQFGVAALLDSQAQPAGQVDGGHNPITSARFGGWSADDARHGWDFT